MCAWVMAAVVTRAAKFRGASRTAYNAWPTPKRTGFNSSAPHQMFGSYSSTAQSPRLITA